MAGTTPCRQSTGLALCSWKTVLGWNQVDVVKSGCILGGLHLLIQGLSFHKNKFCNVHHGKDNTEPGNFRTYLCSLKKNNSLAGETKKKMNMH